MLLHVLANPGHLYILKGSPEDSLDWPEQVETNVNDVLLYFIL